MNLLFFKCPQEIRDRCIQDLSNDIYGDYIKNILNERQIKMLNDIETTMDFNILVDIRKQVRYTEKL